MVQELGTPFLEAAGADSEGDMAHFNWGHMILKEEATYTEVLVLVDYTVVCDRSGSERWHR